MLHFPEEVLESLDSLEYRSLITVMLGLDTPHLNDYTAIYLPDQDLFPHRVSFPPTLSPLTIPKKQFSVMAEITVPKNGSYLKMKDEEIYKNVIEGLTKRNIIKPDSVIYKRIEVLKYAYPVYSLNYMKDMKIIKDFLAAININICGRFGGFEYINCDVCIDQGRKMAEKLNSI